MPDPEALARIDIDRQLEEAGWIVQNHHQRAARPSAFLMPRRLARRSRARRTLSLVAGEFAQWSINKLAKQT
jgi:hypothetical protein